MFSLRRRLLQSLDLMNEWIECFECNARYERVVPPLLEMQKNADQTLRGPAEDCEIAVSALTAAEQEELEEQAIKLELYKLL